MAVTQYIGARYVPLFAEPMIWDSSKEYEPLTIVLYEGASYTSKQSVPAGISITNEEYWALTGNYNAQVEQYRREVRAFDSRITQNTNDIEAEVTARTQADSDLTDAIEAEVTARTEAIEAEVTARTQAVEDLRTDVNQLLDKVLVYDYFKNYNVVFIGDSYTYGTGASDHGSGDTKRFSSLLANWLGATEFNYGVGSTGFCDPGSGGQNAPFKTQVLNAAAAMDETQRNNTHLVVIAGGVNDFNEGATYGFAAMQQGSYDAAKYAEINFPNAIVLVVPMLFKGHDADPRLLNFEDALCAGVGNSWSLPRTVYIKGAWTWNFGEANNYNADKLHPNDTGHRIIASNIYSHILGGDAYKNQLVFITFEDGFGPYEGGVASGTYLNLCNGVIQSFGMSLSGSIGAGEIIKIGAVGGAAVPLTNIMVPVTKGNAQVGVAIMTSGGNLYVRNSSDSSISDFYVGAFSYLPKGLI